MRMIRISVVLFFVASCICFCVYGINERMHGDQNVPVVSVERETLVVSARATEEELLAGVTAVDVEDGDLTDQIQIASMSPLMGENERTVQYIVFDNAGQLGTVSRKIVYNDYTSPRIYLNSPLRFLDNNLPKGVEDMGLVALDCIDGDISWKVRMTYANVISGEETQKLEATFQVNNSVGDTCILPVEIIINSRESEKGRCYPILSEYVVYTEAGVEIDTYALLKGMLINGQEYEFASEEFTEILAEDVLVTSGVNYGEPGIYTIVYSYTTPEEITAETTLYVVVEE